MELSTLPAMSPISPGTDPTQLAGQSNSRDPRAIEGVATGFESIFSSLLVKSMRESLGQGGLFGEEDRGDVLGGMFDYFMGQHLAPAGGLGIAAMVKKQLLARGTR